MNAPVRLRMTPEEYLAWEDRQETKHELVNGEVRAMAGAKVRHNIIANNLLVALAVALKGKPCRPFGSDLRASISESNYRYPDLTVDCGKPNLDGMYADKPTVIIEVLSEANDWFDVRSRLADYQSISTVQQIAFLSSSEARADVWTRTGDRWSDLEIAGLDATLNLTAIEVALALSDAYEGALETPQ